MNLILMLLMFVVPSPPTEDHWPSVDEGCPPSMFADVDPSWDYRDDAWYDANNVMIGVAPEEDSCIAPLIHWTKSRP